MVLYCYNAFGGIRNNGAIIKVKSGTFTTVNGSYLHEANGKCINDGTILLSGDWVNNDSYTGEEDINGTGTLKITGNSTLSGTATKECFEDITISAGASLTVLTGITCHLFGDISRLDASAKFILTNDSNKHGCLYAETDPTDSITINLYLKGNQWTFTTLPFDGYTPTTLFNAELNETLGIAFYDENKRATTKEDWSWCNANEQLKAGQGYIIWSNNDTILTISGLIQTERTLNLEYSDTENGYLHNGWNLVGNYNPTPIDICKSDSACHPERTNVDAAIYVYNKESDDYWTFVDGVGVNLPPDGSKIAPYQAYFMKSNNMLACVCFNTMQRIIDNSIVLRSSYVTTDEVIEISVLDKFGSSQTVVRYKEDATEQFDSDYDAFQISTPKNNPLIYSSYNAEKLAINTLPESCSKSIPIVIQSQTPDSFCISYTIKENSPFYNFYLLDKKYNRIYPIEADQNTLNLSSEQNLIENRFMLIKSQYNVTSLSQHKAQSVSITQNEGNLYITANEIIKGISLYTLDGKLIIRNTENNNTITTNTKGYKGVIIIHIEFNDRNESFKKLIL